MTLLSENDITMCTIDDLLAIREKINKELIGRASQELAAIDKRREQLRLLVDSESPADKTAERRPRTSGIPKYRNPANLEQTWTGRGKRPAWMADVEDVTEFLITV